LCMCVSSFRDIADSPHSLIDFGAIIIINIEIVQRRCNPWTNQVYTSLFLTYLLIGHSGQKLTMIIVLSF